MLVVSLFNTCQYYISLLRLQSVASSHWLGLSSPFVHSSSEPGRTVCRDAFSSGRSACSHQTCKLPVPACIVSVALSHQSDQTPATQIALLTPLSLVLSVRSTESRLAPPCQFVTSHLCDDLGCPERKLRSQSIRPQPHNVKLM
jgi:hypothetical protein